MTGQRRGGSQFPDHGPDIIMASRGLVWVTTLTIINFPESDDVGIGMNDEPLPPLVQLVFGVAIGLFALTMLALLLSFANRSRLKRGPAVSEADSIALQSELLEAIKDASANQRTPVDIRSFWRQRRARTRDRHAVIEPLVARGDVTVAPQAEIGEPWETLRGLWQFALYKPPTRLVLTDRTWTRMVHEGVSGRGIVIGTYVERAEQVNDYTMETGGGDVIGSPMGPRAKARDVRVTKGDAVSSLPPNLVADLVAALRSDAATLQGNSRRDVRSLADDLEDEANEPKPDEDRVLGMVSRASRYVKGAAGLMRASHRALEALQDWT